MSSASTNTMYADLIARFPTSEALFAYLRSEEGGRLIVRDDHLTADLPLTIIFYDKKKSDMTNPLVGAFRSVVWNALTNRPVAAGPHRGLALPVDLSGPFTVEEFIDGVMLNQWWNGEAWQVSSRTQLDAGGSFYGKRPFATLFAEAFAAAGLREADHLDKSVVYSWVLQHPEERIVVSPAYGVPKLWLVERSTFDAATGNRRLLTAPLSIDSPLIPHLPTAFDLHTVADIQARVNANGRRLGAGWQGVVVKTAGGVRYKLRSVQYNAARMLRGNQAKLPYLWLERWSEGKGALTNYLRIFPEEEHAAMETVTAFKTATQEFHDTYLKVYKQRTLKLGDAPIKYRKLIWEARQANVGTYFPSLRDFMNGQDIPRKLWLVNFERRYPVETPAGAAVETTTD